MHRGKEPLWGVSDGNTPGDLGLRPDVLCVNISKHRAGRPGEWCRSAHLHSHTHTHSRSVTDAADLCFAGFMIDI